MTQPRSLGLVADPDVPERVARSLETSLPAELGDEWTCDIQVEVDPVAAGKHDVLDILDALKRHTVQHNWDYAICLTDLPLRRNRRPVLAEISHEHRVAVVALPSLGWVQTRRRARRLIARILYEFATYSAEGKAGPSQAAQPLQSKPARVLSPIRRLESTTDKGTVDVRYVASRGRGRFRLVAGMVRTNRPWRLIFGMSSALAAAVATSAFGLSSSTIWNLAATLDPVREVAAAFASVVLLVAWLIAAHGLWERSSAKTTGGSDRELVQLYNISTALTLIIGVGCMYLGLFVLNFGVATFLVPPSTLSSLVGPSDLGIYVALAWGFTTMGVLAGALGTSLESDAAVRRAAYGYREQQRRAERAEHEEQDTAQPPPDEAAEEAPNSGPTKDELYAQAQRYGVRGRSDMNKQQLLDALDHEGGDAQTSARIDGQGSDRG